VKLSRTRLLLVCLAAPIAMVAATTAPASAASAGAAVVTGTGGINPGLTAVPSCVPPGTGNDFSFDGNAAVTGVINGAAEVNVNHHITASGHDLCGSYAAGAGTINVTIDGLGSANGAFVRVGAVVVVALALPVGNIDFGACAFVAVQTPPAPVTDYSVVCGAAAIQVP
jgi:hypothetical protein